MCCLNVVNQQYNFCLERVIYSFLWDCPAKIGQEGSGGFQSVGVSGPSVCWGQLAFGLVGSAERCSYLPCVDPQPAMMHSWPADSFCSSCNKQMGLTWSV